MIATLFVDEPNHHSCQYDDAGILLFVWSNFVVEIFYYIIMRLGYLLLLNLAPCDISIDNGVGPCLRPASGATPNILSLALCPYFIYCFSNPIILEMNFSERKKEKHYW